MYSVLLTCFMWIACSFRMPMHLNGPGTGNSCEESIGALHAIGKHRHDGSYTSMYEGTCRHGGLYTSMYTAICRHDGFYTSRLYVYNIISSQNSYSAFESINLSWRISIRLWQASGFFTAGVGLEAPMIRLSWSLGGALYKFSEWMNEWMNECKNYISYEILWN